MHETPMTTALALLSALLYAAAPPLLAVVQARDPHHDTVRDPVSDYALGTARGLFQWHGHLGTLAAALMAGVMHLAGLPGWLVACMAAVVLARIGVLLFPTDLEGAPKTASGRLHMGFAVASFALYYTVTDNATPLLAPAAPPALAGVLIALRWLCAWALAALVACLLLPLLRRWFGLAERVFLIAVPAWFAAASLAIAVR